MSAEMVGMSLIVLCLFLAAGMLIRIAIPIFQSFLLPGSIIGGLLSLLLGPQILGRFADSFSGGLIREEFIEVWSTLPGILINVVFASLLLGNKISSPKKIWKTAGPQLTFGMTLSWGMHVIGILLALFVLHPYFGLPYLAGSMLEIGFEGGHGRASGMRETLEELNFAEGADIAIGLAPHTD